MPELPEVETIARNLHQRLPGRRIVRFESRWERQVQPNTAVVANALNGLTVRSVFRRGKQLVFDFDNNHCLLVHLRMSGRFEWGGAGEPEPPHVRAVFGLDDGCLLYFVDARKFGRLRYVDDWRQATAELGDEPLEASFTASRLKEILHGRRKLLKPLLLDQHVIAGLGNIYTDEALFAAGLHPLRLSDSLTDKEIKRLHRQIRRVLTLGIKHNGTSIDWIYPEGRMQRYLKVYGRKGQSCPKCGRTIERLLVGQRSTHICPACQKPVP